MVQKELIRQQRKMMKEAVVLENYFALKYINLKKLPQFILAADTDPEDDGAMDEDTKNRRLPAPPPVEDITNAAPATAAAKKNRRPPAPPSYEDTATPAAKTSKKALILIE